MDSQRRKRDRRGQRGSATVEGALVMIPFLAMALTVVNLGLNFFLIDALQDRASLAARFAALDPTNVEGAKNMLLYGTDQPPGDGTVTTPSPTFMGLDGSSVSVVRLGANTPQDRIVLTISGAQMPSFVPGVKQSITAKAISATVPVELP